jgi:regulator of RNase E activity RraA
VLGDADGVVVVPSDAVEKALNEAERLTSTEVKIRAELAAGATLEQVLAKYGHV